MHSYHNKLLPNHFDEYFIPISSIHSHSTRLTTYFYLELTLPQENVPSPLLALKCDPQYQMILSLQPHLPLNGNWRNTFFMIKIHNYEVVQHFTYPEPNSVFCNSVYFVKIYFSHFFLPCAHPILFNMKAHSTVCFFLLYLINLFLFLFLTFCLNVLLATPNSFN